MGQRDDIRRVQAAVSKKFGVTVPDMVSRRRHRNIVMPRLIAVYLSRTLSGVSEATIGEAFGGRDYTVVRMYCRSIGRRVAEDKAFAAMIQELKSSIGKSAH